MILIAQEKVSEDRLVLVFSLRYLIMGIVIRASLSLCMPLFICISNHVVHQNLLTFSTFYRKKRKWDQPAASLVSAGLAVPGAFPLGNAGLLDGITVPGVTPVTGAHLMNPLEASRPTIPQLYQVPLIPQQTATVIQKLIQVSYPLGIGYSLFIALKDLFCLNFAALSLYCAHEDLELA